TSSTGGALGYAALPGGLAEVRFTLPGDANLDGVVDVGDLGALATSYSATADALWSQGDFNYDGMVDVGDLGALATSYGAAMTGAPFTSAAANVSAVVSATPVPEPSAGLLAAMASLAVGAVSRTRRRGSDQRA